MARISYTVNGQNSCTLSVTELNTTTTYSSVYISCNGYSSSNLAYIGSKVYTSKTWTVTGLSAGTSYYASFNITSASGTTANDGTYFATESAPIQVTVGSVGSVYVSNYGAGSIYVSWSYASNADDYRVEVYNSWGQIVTSTSTWNNNTYIDGLSAGTYYEVKVYARKSGYSNGSPSYGGVTTTSAPVIIGGVGTVYVSNYSTGSISISWSYASNADDYRIEIYDGNGNYVGATTSYSSSVVYNGLSQSTYYSIKVYARKSGYSNGSPSYGSVTTSGVIIGGVGTVYVSNYSTGSISISWSYASNADDYRIEIYDGNLSVIGATTSSSNSVIYYGLSQGVYYLVKVYARKSGYTNGEPSWGAVTTTLITVGSVGTVTASNYDVGKVYLSWSSASNAEDYKVEVYDGWGDYIGFNIASSSSYIYTGLSQGTYYSFKVYARKTGYTNGSPSYAYITTTSYAVGSVGVITATPSTNVASVYLAWSSATRASHYQIYVYLNSTGELVTSTTSTSTSKSITGLEENTSYRATVQGIASGYINGIASMAYFSTVSFAPSAITTLSVVASTATKGKIDMYWNISTNATSYRWEIYRGNTTNSSYLVVSDSSTTNNVSYSSLSEYTLYTVKVYATRSGYSNGSSMTTLVTTKDLTPPILSNVTGETVGKMYLSFSATDAHSGLRDASRYYTEISSNGGSTYGQGSYSMNAFRTFTVDASGNAFEQNAYYYMRVTTYDNDGNTAVSSVRIQFKGGKPNNWAWHTTKTSGNTVSLTASEWNSFCLRVNQFRQYKGYDDYNFTSAYSGGIITAVIVNQARSAIATMTPPSSVPSATTAGANLTALYFNSLSISLNSIS